LIKLNVIFLIIVVVVFVGCGNNNDSKTDDQLKETTGMSSEEIEQQAATEKAFKKYPIRSGMVTFKRGGIIGSNKIIVYFSDYGVKERNEVFGEDGMISEITMSDGVNMYKFTKESLVEKTTYVMGPGLHGTEMQFIIDPFKNSEKRKAKYEYQQLGNMNIIGKDCEAYCVKSGGGKTTFAGWEGILLYSKVEISMGTMETVAVDFVENADVDPNLFKIPADYKIEKM